MKNKPKFICKSALDDAQLRHAVELGADGIELQLYEEFYVSPKSIKTYGWGSFVNLPRLVQYPITSIHMPIRKEYNTNFENLLVTDHSNVFSNICSLANAIGQARSSRILVVMHCEMGYNQLNETGLLEIIAEKLRIILAKYPYVELGIENLMPIVTKDNKAGFRNGFGDSNVQLVKDLRARLRINRIGTVLDTCHALSSIRIMQDIYTNILNMPDAMYGMEYYMRSNAGVCSEIHLASVRGFGFNEADHGIAFDEQSPMSIEAFVEMYKNMHYECPICIEMREQDYCDRLNFIKTREDVKALFPTKENPRFDTESVFLKRP